MNFNFICPVCKYNNYVDETQKKGSCKFINCVNCVNCLTVFDKDGLKWFGEREGEEIL